MRQHISELLLLKKFFPKNLANFIRMHAIGICEPYHFRNNSWIKHHFQSSPGTCDFITGWSVSLKYFVPCFLGDESQHPTWPHSKHNHKCTQLEPNYLTHFTYFRITKNHWIHPMGMRTRSIYFLSCLIIQLIVNLVKHALEKR